MQILLISDYDRLAVEINEGFKNLGHQSTLLSTRNEFLAVNISNIKKNKLIWFKDAIRAFLYRKVFLWVGKSSYYQDISERDEYYSIDRIKSKVDYVPNVIIILFDYRIITSRTVQALAKWSNAKIYWMMVDMKPMTGGCAYSGQCTKYQSDCKGCPLIKNSLFSDFAYKQLSTKIELLKDVNLNLIAGSSYQEKQARLSTVFKNRPIHKAIFPVNNKTFFPRDKFEARSKLGLPVDKQIIMFGAMRVNDPRKGYQYLLKAISLLVQKRNIDDLLLLVVGSGSVAELEEMQIPVVSLGLVNYEKLALSYQSADIFVCPTIEDSGPVMVSQSLLSGTPVVAFKMGVSIDLVINGKTGFIFELGDHEGLCSGIENILDLSPKSKEMMNSACVEHSIEVTHDSFFKRINKLITH
jgi:glycosyltransferase involved in cell wall biosynthesis